MTENPLILIIDDNPDNVQVLGALLSDEGYNPAGVSSGEKALMFLDTRKPDLILLDVLMPDINGYDLCLKITKDETNKGIPIIFLTAKTEEDDILQGFKAGGVDYITKPFHTSELLARVRTHIELKLVREKLFELSITDDLTGLNNRRHFKSEMEKELQRATRHNSELSLAVIDLDHFKQINDTYGHEIGDQVLSGLAALFPETFRKCDVVGRLGGEEFAVMLPETDMKGAVLVMDRFRALLEKESVKRFPLKKPVTISVGLTCMQETNRTLDRMLHEADMAMYKAKQSGRNQVCVYDRSIEE